MKHKLLVPVDGQKGSWKTVLYAANACSGHGAKTWGVVLFHVLPEFPATLTQGQKPLQQIGLLERFDRETRDAGRQLLAELKARMIQEGVSADAVTVKIARERGKVVEQILWAGTEERCDTIVVGRRGKSMFGQFLSRGVVEQLLRHPVGFTVWVVE